MQLGGSAIDLGARAVAHGLIDVDDARVGLVLQNPTGTVVHADAVAAELLGLSHREVVGREASDPRWGVVAESGAPMPVDQHPASRVLATGEPVRGQVVGVHHPGTDHIDQHVWLRVSSVPVHEGALTALTLITGTEAATLRLREAERLLRLVVQNTTDVVALQLPSGVLLWVSPAVERVLGHDPVDLVGTWAGDLVHPDDRAQGHERVAEAVQGKPERLITMRMRHADGRWLWMESSARAVVDVAGGLEQVLTSSRDVTARVAAEQTRDAAVRLFTSAMEHAPVGMAMRPVDGLINQVNRALCVMLGRSPAQLLGTGLSEITHPDDLVDVEVGLAGLLTGELAVHESERRYLRGDGTTMWGARTTVLLRDAEGEPEHFLTQVQDITARKLASEELQRQAVTDPLTGLPNRVVLMDRLTQAVARARRSRTLVGVVFVDLDHFKTVNDTLGHDVGDELLRQVAARMQAAVRDGDTVVRLGGDEFVVLCEEVRSPAEVRLLAERICAAQQAPFLVRGQEVSVSASVGVTIGDGPSAAALLKRADASMYEAKRDGRGRVDVRSQAEDAVAVDQLAMLEELRHGIDQGQLRLEYQPVVRLADDEVVAREALVRWEHPVRGLLCPADFLAAAEQSRLITTLGEWCLWRACADAAGWSDGAVLHVNVSARHLAAVGFPQLVRTVLAETGLAPRRLCLEITESLVLTASPSTLSSTRELTGLGVRLVLDDFGTGSSSITALYRLPVRAFKIDRSFVADLPADGTAASLVDGLIRLGAGMGLDVIAEGVETVEQAQWLAAHGCPHAQGYYYGRPQPQDVPA